MSSDNKENAAVENLKDGYEQIKTIYQIQADRLKTADEKLNMLLVFNAAIIALLTVVVPFPETVACKTLSLILFFCFYWFCFRNGNMYIYWSLPKKIGFYRC